MTNFQRLRKYLVKQPPPYTGVFHSAKPGYVIRYLDSEVTGIYDQEMMYAKGAYDNDDEFLLEQINIDDVTIYQKLKGW